MVANLTVSAGFDELMAPEFMVKFAHSEPLNAVPMATEVAEPISDCPFVP